MTAISMTAISMVTGGFAATATVLAIGPSARGRLAVIGAEDGLLGAGGLRHARARSVLLGAISVTALFLLAGTAATAAVVAAVAIGGAIALRVRGHQRARAIRLAVYEMCRAIAAELRAGSTPASAFRAAAAMAPQPLFAAVHPVASEAANGDPAELADAIAAAATGPPYHGLRTLAACWRVVVASGAMIGPAIDRVADALHDEIDLDRELDTSLAASRATVRLLAALPLVGLALGMAIGAQPLAFLLGSPAGWACLLLAALFDGAGVWWVRHITRGAIRASQP
mgnify:CR=1 FL=1